MQVQTNVVKHGFLLVLNVYHFQNLVGEPVRQFLILETFLIAAAAIPDDQIDIMGGYIPATDVTEIIAFTVKGADRFIRHKDLIC